MTETTETDDHGQDAQAADRLTATSDGGHAVPDDDAADRSPAGHAGDADPGGALLGADFQRTLQGGAIVVLGLLATWATFQAYASASEAIGIWISDDFVPIFEAAFNVAVVLVALAGIVWLVRRLT